MVNVFILRPVLYDFFEPPGEYPAQWYNQWNTGRLKSHRFFFPSTADCPEI